MMLLLGFWWGDGHGKGEEVFVADHEFTRKIPTALADHVEKNNLQGQMKCEYLLDTVTLIFWE
jgi:hypothetical protein